MIDDWIPVAAQTNREVDKQRKEGDEGWRRAEDEDQVRYIRLDVVIAY